MTLAELKKELANEFRLSLNPNSKFFNADIKSFNDRLKDEKDEDKLITQLGNLRCLNGKSRLFNKMIKELTKELDKGGMFDIGKIKPINALD
jgi:hypothetical protein